MHGSECLEKLFENHVELIVKVRLLLFAWAKKNYSNFPWRNPKNQFHGLVAEIMLQRTKAEQVLPVYPLFVEKYSSPKDIVQDSESFLKLLEPLGLRWRNKEILNLCLALHKKGDRIPSRRKELLNLPGVGPYIADAYLSLHKGIRSSIIDANVVRLWGRILGFETDNETRRKKWFIKLVDQITPEKNFKQFNYAIIDFSRTVCGARPMCHTCTIASLCEFYRLSH